MNRFFRNILMVILVILMTFTVSACDMEVDTGSGSSDYENVDHTFRSESKLKDHYRKHGIEMGYDSPEEYQYYADQVIHDKSYLHKTEKEDGDDVYYDKKDNEIVFVSKDGYIRTYFEPNNGMAYYNRQ